ncbi:DgyrCDS3872 [Dimorphilus gyrociliatus]|uniref:DgyrCDS3872 n=1 Tax=Dimorphilus gyrociliatus TaxID=2664684 RepID=A0A7I8VEN9_9ANNE|nr:DgyrCDS3872 [Dimorphilus gyrociliatus]
MANIPILENLNYHFNIESKDHRRPLKAEINKLLQNNQDKLVQCISLEDIISDLKVDDVISGRQYERLCDRDSGSEAEKIRSLLTHLQKRSNLHFLKFCNVLERFDQGHIVEELKIWFRGDENVIENEPRLDETPKIQPIPTPIHPSQTDGVPLRLNPEPRTDFFETPPGEPQYHSTPSSAEPMKRSRTQHRTTPYRTPPATRSRTKHELSFEENIESKRLQLLDQITELAQVATDFIQTKPATPHNTSHLREIRELVDTLCKKERHLADAYSGSLILLLHCCTLNAVDDLWLKCKTGYWSERLTRIFCKTEPRWKISVSIDESKYIAYRNKLIRENHHKCGNTINPKKTITI